MHRKKKNSPREEEITRVFSINRVAIAARRARSDGRGWGGRKREGNEGFRARSAVVIPDEDRTSDESFISERLIEEKEYAQKCFLREKKE